MNYRNLSQDDWNEIFRRQREDHLAMIEAFTVSGHAIIENTARHSVDHPDFQNRLESHAVLFSAGLTALCTWAAVAQDSGKATFMALCFLAVAFFYSVRLLTVERRFRRSP